PILPSVLFLMPPALTEIYTLSLHDALPICRFRDRRRREPEFRGRERQRWRWFHQRRKRDRIQRPRRLRQHRQRHLLVRGWLSGEDRKSTRLNSSHVAISYAVFCLKKKSRWQ